MEKKKFRYNYSSILKWFKLYEYMYQCAMQELGVDDGTSLVSDRTERLVIEYPDKFIKKYFPSPPYPYSDEDMREILYDILRSKRLSILMWTDDNRSRCGAGKDTIHIIKPNCFLDRVNGEINILLEVIEKKKNIRNKIKI